MFGLTLHVGARSIPCTAAHVDIPKKVAEPGVHWQELRLRRSEPPCCISLMDAVTKEHLVYVSANDMEPPATGAVLDHNTGLSIGRDGPYLFLHLASRRRLGCFTGPDCASRYAPGPAFVHRSRALLQEEPLFSTTRGRVPKQEPRAPKGSPMHVAGITNSPTVH